MYIDFWLSVRNKRTCNLNIFNSFQQPVEIFSLMHENTVYVGVGKNEISVNTSLFHDILSFIY